jgi:catechol 2,3-dioxygenase-like lactoylglutathione lyase family enzyme
MTIVLNHTIVPVADKERGARLLAGLLGVEAGPPAGPFAQVRVNDDLTQDFDAALAYAVRSGLEYGSAPRVVDQQINHLGGGRGVYVRDPDGIAYEFFTAVP